MKKMTRKKFIRDSALTVAGLGLVGNLVKAKPPVGSRPNILFIFADDLGWGDIGCYGQTKIRTPHLDKMARNGMLFTSGYAGSTICGASRSCLLTGQHTGHTTCRDLASPVQPTVTPILRNNDITFAKLLQQAGYKTGCFGKWGLGDVGDSGHPNNQGFDEFYGYLDHTHAHFYYTDYLFRNSTSETLSGNLGGQKNQYTNDLITDEALLFIDNYSTQSFLCYVPYTIPHAELAVPQDSLNEYLGKFPETPYVDSSGHYASQANPHAAYAAMITRLDSYVGRFLQKLKQRGIEEKTLIIFSSDNGPSTAGGIDPVFFNSNGPMSGLKRDLLEGGVRVPLLAQWKGTIKPGSVSDQFCAFWDLLPTFTEMSGLENPASIDGISLLPVLKGQPQKEHEFLYYEFYGRGYSQAVRMREWKAVRRSSRNNPVELYKLNNDIAESQDVSAQYPEITNMMADIMKVEHNPDPLWPES